MILCEAGMLRKTLQTLRMMVKIIYQNFEKIMVPKYNMSHALGKFHLLYQSLTHLFDQIVFLKNLKLVILF
jgi:hypothetical protein